MGLAASVWEKKGVFNRLSYSFGEEVRANNRLCCFAIGEVTRADNGSNCFFKELLRFGMGSTLMMVLPALVGEDIRTDNVLFDFE